MVIGVIFSWESFSTELGFAAQIEILTKGMAWRELVMNVLTSGTKEWIASYHFLWNKQYSSERLDTSYTPANI